ncbi:MAG: hypothetical protein WB698_06660 [Solirubrobacteraceae bacterium]
MSIKPKFAGLFGLAAVTALLVMAVGASGASAFSEFKAAKFPVAFTGTGGTATFESENKNVVTCEKSASTGSVKSAISATVIITYSGKCQLKAESPLKFTESCPTITTTELLIMPVQLLNGKASLLIASLSGPTGTIAKFTCTGEHKVEVTVTGSVICGNSPIGVSSKTGTVTCKKGTKAGEQEFTESENSAKEKTKNVLTATSTLGIFKVSEKDSQETTEAVTYAENVEQTE